jgi:hypothetical protein
MIVLILLGAFPAQAKDKDLEGLINNRLVSLRSYLAVVSFRPAFELELAFWQQDEYWRQEWILDQENSSLLWAAVGWENTLLAAYPHQEKISLPLLKLWHRPKAALGWEEAGVDLQSRDYAFQGDLPCQVLGGSELGAAQLWLDVQQDLPRRLILPSGLQLDWLQYQNVGNFPLPHQVRIQSKGLYLEGKILWKSVNTPLPQNLFLQDSVPKALETDRSSQAARQLLQRLQSALPKVD